MPRFRRFALYARYGWCSFQRRAAYRLANWTGIAVNFFFFLIHAQIYLAFFGERDQVVGWRPEDAVLYFGISESLLMVLGAFPGYSGWELMERIRTGAVTLDLTRPVRLYPRDLAERCGGAAYAFATRTIVLLIGVALVYGVVPPLRSELLLLPLVLAIGIAISATLWFLMSASAFWIEHAQGPMGALMILSWLFGGAAIPLDFYPDSLRMVCDVLPFRATIYTPVALAAGRLEGTALAFGLAHQVAWLSILVVLARAVEERGVRRLVAHGG
jgi:ABC-2 type transport system permease protein